MSTVTGNGKQGFAGDGGPAASGQVWSPGGMAVALNGGLYFADIQNSRIRAIGAPPVGQLTSVVSTKTHGNAGAFDLYVQQGAEPGIECRSDSGNYTLTFTFETSLTNVDSASVSTGVGSVASSNIDPADAHNYIVNLTGVDNAQTIAVSLTNVQDVAHNFSSALSVSMGVLIGDVNASRRVDAADVSLVRQQTLQTIDSSDFREDINASGRIDAADVSVARQQALTSLP
jgi:hypothetical protein